MKLGKTEPRHNRFYLILCVMGVFAILSSTMSKTPVLNPFAESLGTPGDLLGVVAAASTIPGILVSLPAASLSDIVGRKKVLLFSALIFASAPFLYLAVANWWQLALVRFYHGFATAIFVPVTEVTIAEHFPNNRGERISLLNSATGLGRTIAPILGGLILTLTGNGFHTLYIAIGIAGLTAFALAFLLSTERRAKQSAFPISEKVTAKMFHGWSQIIKNREVLVVSFVQAAQYYVYGSVEFFVVGYMINIAKLDALYSGIFLSVEVATLIISRPILGRISDEKGRRLPILLGSLIGAALLFAVPFTISFPTLLIVAIGYGFGFSMVISSTSPLITEVSPADLVGASMGFLCTLMDVGQTLGPIASGLILASTFGYSGIFVSLSAILLVSGLFFSISTSIQRKT